MTESTGRYWGVILSWLRRVCMIVKCVYEFPLEISNFAKLIIIIHYCIIIVYIGIDS